MPTSHLPSHLTPLALALTIGCVEPLDAAPDRAPGGDLAAIVSTRPPQVEIVASHYYDPAVARASYAAGMLGAGWGCSASMIGPTTVMTAAHCGTESPSPMQFYLYRNNGAAAADRTIASFTCHSLLQSFDDTDVLLFDCPPPVANGLGPGDIFGYLDFAGTAASAEPVVGEAVYSLWTNPLDRDGGNIHLLYSPGHVTSVTDNSWHVPDAAPNTGIVTDVWGWYGASGSPQLDAATHRIVVGPTTGAPDPEGPSRSAESSRNLFRWAAVSATEPCPGCANRNIPYLLSLGLVPDAYLGWLDDTIDGVFDVQADLERQRGEGVRDLYWLGFDSARRNLLWDRGAGVTFDIAGKTARIARNTGSATEAVLRHSRLRGVGPAGEYRVRLTIDVARAAAGSTLTLALRAGTTNRATAAIALTPGVTTQTLRLLPGQSASELAFLLQGDVDVKLSAVSVHVMHSFGVAAWATNSFDLADERAAWINAPTGGPAPIRPDGEFASATTADWAGRNLGPLDDIAFPMVAGRSQRVCFRHKLAGISGALPNVSDWGLAQLRSGSTTLATTAFRPVSNWSTTCTPWSTPTAGNIVFRFDTLGSQVVFPGAHYLVDSVRLESH